VGSVCVVGSANVDLVASVARLPAPGETVLATGYQTHPGGKGHNQAVAAARAGADVAFVGAVGSDAEGELLRASLRAEGVALAGLGTADAPTGRALITVDSGGQNAIVVVAGANAALSELTVRQAQGQIKAARVVLAQLEVADGAVSAAFVTARASGVTTVLNAAPARDVPALLSLTDVLVVNELEAARLSATPVDDAASAEAAARRLLAAGPSTVVVTLGAEGALAVRQDEIVRQAAFPVTVVDTTGAGDAACGALAAALAADEDLPAALARACAAGALAASELGATPAALNGPAIARLVSSAT
jgi:ribokinase